MFKKAHSYIGIDIGVTSVKIVELQNIKGKPTLINYGYSDEVSDFNNQSLEFNVDKIAAIIKKLRAKTGIKEINAVAAMPSFSVFSSVLNLHNIKKEDIDSAVQWEAKKVVPLNLEEMILDWKIIDEQGGGVITENANTNNEYSSEQVKKIEDKNKKNIKILLTGAPKMLVKKYIDIFKQTELRLVSLETETFSLIRSLVGPDPSVIAIVDLGAVNTDIAIVENGLPMFVRSLDAGGIMVTKAISDSLNVNFKRSEQFKFDLGAANGHADTSLPKIIEDAIANIINEIKYSLNLFQQENNKKIEKIILSGGGAHLANISDYLSKTMDMNVIIGNPWSRVAYPLDLKMVLDEIGPQMAVAVGLALREIV